MRRHRTLTLLSSPFSRSASMRTLNEFPFVHAELAAFMIVYIVHRTLTLLCNALGRQEVIEVPSCTSRTVDPALDFPFLMIRATSVLVVPAQQEVIDAHGRVDVLHLHSNAHEEKMRHFLRICVSFSF